MTYMGTVRDGVVIFRGDEKPPEGADVRIEVEPAHAPLTPEAEKVKRLRESLLSIAGTGDPDMPPDASINVDHYLYGLPKR